ncbi:NARE ribosyltransferase, partial [Atlantisia rogersi]|nr:NARE ribosyltransferase [Atlantisia rogersi]
LDMASNSFDDQYLGCSDKMEEELQELNRTEFESNKIYAAAWKKASAMLQGHTSQPSVLKPAQAIALMAYTLETPSLYLNFNSAVRQAGHSREQYLHNFQFKAMHFLLTKALQALRKRGQCYNVYRGVKKVFTAQPGDTVRFGQFASTSLNKNCAESFGMGTIFSVQTCYGVPIWDFSYFATEKEVLIPPFEAFEVTSVTHKGNSARIELQSQGMHSNYNCEFVRGDDLEDG